MSQEAEYPRKKSPVPRGPVPGSKGESSWRVRFDDEIKKMNQDEGNQRKSALRKNAPQETRKEPLVIDVDKRSEGKVTPEEVEQSSDLETPKREVNLRYQKGKGAQKGKPRWKMWGKKGKGGKGKGKAK